MIKKIAFSLFIILFILFSLLETFDTKSSEQLDTSFNRALTTFAMARVLNGLVSVVQGTEVNVSPAGLGATFAPGQLLDPINDMVERFSWVMLMSTVSIGIQEVMLELGKSLFFKVLFSITGLLFLLQLWTKKSFLPWSVTGTFQVIIILGVLRFSVPFLVMLNGVVYEQVLSPEYNTAFTLVEKHTAKVELMVENVRTKEQQVQKSSSFIDRFNVSRKYENFKREMRAQVDAFIRQFNMMMESMIKLITVFILNTIVIPIGALWLFIWGGKLLFRMDFKEALSS